MSEIRFEPISDANFVMAVGAQHEVFPDYSAKIDYENSLSGRTNNRYELVYLEDICIGFTGLYQVDVDLESAWLGWFGLLPQYRRRGYGSVILRHFEDTARARGYKYARIYTDKFDNDAAIGFYTSQGYTCEDYINPNDPISSTYKVLIFSKSLCSEPAPAWGNKNIGLTREIQNQTANS